MRDRVVSSDVLVVFTCMLVYLLPGHNLFKLSVLPSPFGPAAGILFGAGLLRLCSVRQLDLKVRLTSVIHVRMSSRAHLHWGRVLLRASKAVRVCFSV